MATETISINDFVKRSGSLTHAAQRLGLSKTRAHDLTHGNQRVHVNVDIGTGEPVDAFKIIPIGRFKTVASVPENG